MLRYLASPATAVIAAAAFASTASAQDYVSASAGFSFQSDSVNSGALTRDFTTGDGVAVPAGTVLPAGTSVGWDTEFDDGLFLAAAYGRRFDENWRVEFEISQAKSDVDTHTDVTVGGGAIGAADAAVLITGSAALGATVAEIVADGQGEISTLAYSVNAFYDLPMDGYSLYLGAGIGLAEVEVDFVPSGVTIINDDAEATTLFQVMAGGAYPISDTTEMFGGYRYRTTGDVTVDASLFPASLDIENDSHILEFGVRFSF